jgi:cytochrome c553
MGMRDLVGLACAVVAPFIQAGSARAADLSLGAWSFSWNEQAQIEVSVPVDNIGPTDSGPLTITLWATEDPRNSTALTQGFRLVEVTVDEGVSSFEFVEVNSGFQRHIEEPDPGTYNIALTVDEEGGLDTSPQLVSFSTTLLTFPLPVAPSQSSEGEEEGEAEPEGDGDAGRGTFEAHCQVCHGARGAGGMDDAPDLAERQATELQERFSVGHESVEVTLSASDYVDLAAFLAEGDEGEGEDTGEGETETGGGGGGGRGGGLCGLGAIQLLACLPLAAMCRGGRQLSQRRQVA